jgi:sigma-54 specific flagellar transcriptional regulator A
MNVTAGRPRVQFSSGALACLLRHSWPGNVRELGNLVERLSILNGSRLITATDLPPRYRPADWQPDAAADQVIAALIPMAAQAVVTAVPDLVVEPPSNELISLNEREALLLLEDGPRVAGGTILPADGLDLRAHVAAIEESLIRQALERSQGIVAQAARLLGLRRTTLVEKLRKFDITAGDDSSED